MAPNEAPPASTPASERPAPATTPVDLETVKVSVPLAVPFSEAERALRVRPGEVLGLIDGQTSVDDTRVITMTHPALPWLRVPVRVVTRTPAHRAHGAVISIEWTPIRFERLLPAMEADLLITATQGDHVELTLDGRYRPPLGLVGLLFNRFFGRQIARSTARAFLQRIASRIEQET